MMKRRFPALAAALACMMGGIPMGAWAEELPEDAAMENGYYVWVVNDGLLVSQLRSPEIKYGLELGHLGHGINRDEIVTEGEPAKAGDILWFSDYDSIAETYPCCIHLSEDTVVKNLGQIEEIAEQKTLIVTWDNGYTYRLQDAEDRAYTFVDDVNRYLENPMMEGISAGDCVDFWVYKDYIVKPIGKSETQMFEPKTFVVVDSYDSMFGGPGFILMNEKGESYIFSEQEVEECLLKGEKFPECGDIISLQGMLTQTEKVGTNYLNAHFVSPDTQSWDAPGIMRNHGSIIENGKTAKFTVESSLSDYKIHLTDAKGETYTIYNDFWDEGDVLYEVADGETVEMYTYNGIPMIPTQQVTLPVAQYAVVGVRDDGVAIMQLREDKVYFLANESMASIMADGQKAPQYGDILKISGYPFVNGEEIVFCTEYGRKNEGGSYEKLASVTEEQEVQSFRYWKEPDESFCTLTYSTAEGRKGYNYELDFTSEFEQPEGFDWATVEGGDYVDMLTYEGKPILPIYIEVQEINTAEFVVVGVDDTDAPQNYVVMEIVDYFPKPYYLPAELVAKHYKGEDTIVFGDILSFKGKFEGDGKIGTQHFAEFTDYTEITKTGTIYEWDETEICTMEPSSVGELFKIQRAGKSVIRTFMDYADTYRMPDAVSWKDIKAGDKATMLVYQGIPCIPVELDPLGDVDGSGELDILDVIHINRHVLGAADLPAAKRKAGELGQADFNGNGKIDPDDSLGMLKRIVGIG